MSLPAAEDAVGQAGCGLPLLPAEAATATAPTPAWGRARGTFPAWSPAKEACSRAEGAGGRDPAGGRHEGRAAGDRGGKAKRGESGSGQTRGVGMSCGPVRNRSGGGR